MLQGTVTRTVWQTSIPQKIEWDSNVPDSKRDILKILSQTLTGHITDYQVKDNVFTAVVELFATVLYLPEGEKTTVCSLSAADTLRFEEELPRDTAWDFSMVHLNVTPYSPVFVNSRKAGIRGQLSLQIKLVENVALPAVTAEGCELLSETVHSFSTPAAGQEQFSYTLSFPLPAGKPPIAEILESEAAVRNPELKAISNKAVAKGDLEIRLLYRSTQETLETAEFSSPFTEILDVGNLDEECHISYGMKPCILDVQVMENEENEAKNLSFQGRITVQLTATKPETIALIRDAYHPKYQVSLRKKSFPLETCTTLPREAASQKEIVTLTDAQPEEIIAVTCTPKLSGATVKDAVVTISAVTQCRILYRSAKGIHCVEKELPLELTQSAPVGEAYTDVSVQLEQSHCSYHIIGPDRLEVRISLFLDTVLSQRTPSEYVESIFIDEDAPLHSDRAPIVAYIVRPEDTLFQIAKTYATTVERIKAINNLENDRSLKAGSYLIIE